MRNNFPNRIRSERSRLLDLESHVVSIRDCLQCLFNRFHTSASTNWNYTRAFPIINVRQYRDKLNVCVNDGAIISAESLRALAGILSRSVHL